MSLYRLRPRAASDLEAIWDYTFEKWSKTQADSYYNDIISTLDNLASGALRGRVSDVKDDYMTYPVGSHIIIHRFSGSSLDVVRILHQSMDFVRHL